MGRRMGKFLGKLGVDRCFVDGVFRVSKGRPGGSFRDKEGLYPPVTKGPSRDVGSGRTNCSCEENETDGSPRCHSKWAS